MKSCLFLVCCCVFVFDICSTFMLRLLYFENQKKKSYFSTRTEKARCTDPSQRDKLKMGRSRAISLPRNVLGLNFFVLHHNHSNVVSVLKYIHICVFVCIFWYQGTNSNFSHQKVKIVLIGNSRLLNT